MSPKDEVLAKYPNAICLEYSETDLDYFDKDLGCTIYGEGFRKRYRIEKYSWSGYVKDMPPDLSLAAEATEELAWESAARRVRL